MITVHGLTREFTVTEREPGLRAALKSVARREQRVVTAIDDLTFSIASGGVTGFLGPNGSGKTTTLKCLAGLLTPTRGSVEVLGYTPSERHPEFLRQLGFVMGQRWQLNVDIPVLESFELHRVVYDLDTTEFRQTRDELIELLDLGDVARQVARKLSLGQRMRCEFAASLLHRPSVVLLDEPTLGLDFDAQQQIRSFVGAYVELTGAAVLLTSHYLADIEALCHDVMTISRGRITYTGTLHELQQMAGDQKLITVRLSAPVPRASVAQLGEIREHTDTTLVLEVRRGAAGEAVGVLEHLEAVADVSLADPPLEDTLRALYDIPVPP
ncbi:putative ABC transporter related [metagenome]|uniref:Putative ABC transporter related n=1 Tax=metagenome TaxID=256318 RepID=A0A2P2CBZ9_9ZZZZ